MFKKVLYVIGGIFAFLVFVVIIAPHSPPQQNTTQTKQDNVVVENDATKVVGTPPVVTLKTEDTSPQTTNKPTQQTTQQIQQKSETPETNKPTVSSIQTPQYIYYSVINVVDGDTIKINMNGTTETLRLIGIDTPETVDPRKPVQCFGKEASNKAKELLSGQKIRIEKDLIQGERDKYDRLLAYIYREDGLFYNKYIIEQGYAHEYTYNLPYKYQAEFKVAEKYARENQLGLWSPTTCSGDTAKAAIVSTQNTNTNQIAGKYYTSSYASSKYYYPASCSAWQNLSSSYLKVFDSLEALLIAYPSRSLSPQCQ